MLVHRAGTLIQPFTNPAVPMFQTDDLPQLLQTYHVPGASLAVFAKGRLIEAAAGITNLNTGISANADTLFQIGSITKLYTTVLILQLVESGQIDLDVAVRTYLPELRLADEAVAAQVTLRQLLSHTSGIDGDFFKDAGRGEDRIEKFVSFLGDLPSLAPPGHMFGYCNVGFVIAGRIIEKVTGLGWDKAIRTRLIKPLGTPMFSTLPEQAMRHRTAIGHLGNAETGLFASPIAYLAQSNAPAGSTPMATARDVTTFARMLMDGGIAPNGAQILAAASVNQMHEPQVVCPPNGPMHALGLGAFLWNWGGAEGGYAVSGHDGSTIGQAAFLRIHAESGTAMVLLTNGGDGKGLAHELMARIFTATCGIAPPPPPSPDAALTFDATRYVGTYGKSSETAEVTARDGALFCRMVPAADYGVIDPGNEIALQPVSPDHFIGLKPGMSRPVNFSFLETTDGPARYLYSGAIAYPRIDQP